MASTEEIPSQVDKLVRSAVICAMIGMILVSIFLIGGFGPNTVGLGVFIGMPLLTIGVILYIIAVIRDLRQSKILDE